MSDSKSIPRAPTSGSSVCRSSTRRAERLATPSIVSLLHVSYACTPLLKSALNLRERVAAPSALWRESRVHSRMALGVEWCEFAPSVVRDLLRSPSIRRPLLEPTEPYSSPLVGNAADASRGENKKPVAANIVSPNAINEIERGHFGSRKKEHRRITGYV